MCYNCWEKNGKQSIVNEKTKRAAELINKIYATLDCGAGGYAHIVTDDWNLEDDNIDHCILSSKNGESDDYICEESRLICLECMEYMRTLTELERYSAMAISRNWVALQAQQI